MLEELVMSADSFFVVSTAGDPRFPAGRYAMTRALAAANRADTPRAHRLDKVGEGLEPQGHGFPVHPLVAT